jgi:hypothetical protein
MFFLAFIFVNKKYLKDLADEDRDIVNDIILKDVPKNDNKSFQDFQDIGFLETISDETISIYTTTMGATLDEMVKKYVKEYTFDQDTVFTCGTEDAYLESDGKLIPRSQIQLYFKDEKAREEYFAQQENQGDDEAKIVDLAQERLVEVPKDTQVTIYGQTDKGSGELTIYKVIFIYEGCN